MARFVADMPTGKPDDAVRFIAEDFLTKEGFKQLNYKNELVWKKGNGLVTGPQFIKFSTYNGNVHLEAWIKNAILPGVYVGEYDLNGGYGFALKQALKNRVDALARLLYQPVNTAVTAPVMASPSESVPSPMSAPIPLQPPLAPQEAAQRPLSATQQPAGQVPVYQTIPVQQPYSGMQAPFAPPRQPVPMAVHDPRDKATLSLIMGFVSILGCFVPIAGVIAGIVGIISGSTGRKSSARGMAAAGLVLSVVFLIISVLNWAAGIYINLARL